MNIQIECHIDNCAMAQRFIAKLSLALLSGAPQIVCLNITGSMDAPLISIITKDPWMVIFDTLKAIKA